jgi:hypothetical protein
MLKDESIVEGIEPMPVCIQLVDELFRFLAYELLGLTRTCEAMGEVLASDH